MGSAVSLSFDCFSVLARPLEIGLFEFRFISVYLGPEIYRGSYCLGFRFGTCILN